MRATRVGRLGFALLLATVQLVLAKDRDLRLINAVKDGDKAAVPTLLQQGVDVNTSDGSGATALHWAAYRDDQGSAGLLIQKGAAVNRANELGVTPLRLACTNSSTAMIARLLEAGADPNIAPTIDGTPLMIASHRGNAEAVKLLIVHGARVDEKEASQGQTALMWAVSEKHPEVTRLLLEHGADVQARSKSWRRYMLWCCQAYEGDPDGGVFALQGGFTPLLFAARVGDVDSARLLLRAGANINDKTAVGMSVLVTAALSGQREFALFALDNGADPSGDDAGYSALHSAVLRSDMVLAKALINRGANVNARQRAGSPSRRYQTFAFDKLMIGATPFVLATRSAQLDMMRLLASSGADVNLPLDDGTSPVMAAAQRIRGVRVNERQSLSAIELALQLGSKINTADHHGDTALHIAASRRRDSVIQFLVDKGADLNAKNKEGETPLAAVLKPLPPPKGAGIPVFDEYSSLVKGTERTAELLRKLGARE
jgi:ankyrin repeat protein